MQQYLYLMLQHFELFQFSLQKMLGKTSLFFNASGCQYVCVSQLVVAAAKIIRLNPTFINQRSQTKIDFPQTDPQAHSQTALACSGLIGELT